MNDVLPIPIEQRYRDFMELWKKAVRKLSKGAIHDFRTATRRLLAALALTESLARLPEIEKLRRRVEKALRAVGPMRDVHVQQDHVAGFDDAARFESFQKHLRKLEKREAKRIGRKLSHVRRRKIRRDFRHLDRLLCETLPALDKELLRDTLEKTVQDEKEEISQLAGHGFRDKKTEQLHHLRIRIKGLRYMLEIVHPHEMLADLRMLQKEIGHIHDLSELAREVRKWVEDADDNEANNIKALHAAIRRRRQKAVQTLNKRRAWSASKK